MNTHIFTKHIDWNGITLGVSWEPDWLRCAVGHLQITSIAPERAPLPVSETGYRSLFVNPALVTAEGGPVTFAREWLAREALSLSWRATQDEARQLLLL
jgi:hypothetical protein